MDRGSAARAAMIRLGILVEALRPYHMARLAALPTGWSVVVFEDALSSAEVGEDAVCRPRIRKVYGHLGSMDQRDVCRVVESQALDFVLIPGWSSLSALVLIRAAVQLAVPVIILSDSAEQDYRRGPIQEFFKRLYLLPVHGALVAGDKHRQYLSMLGVKQDRIRLGYDVVDNQYFKSCSKYGSNRGTSAPEGDGAVAPYVFCCARLVAKKNISVLLEAFALFLEAAKLDGTALVSWRLIVAGEGPLRSELVNFASNLGIVDQVDFPGSVDYSALPDLYRNAQIFVLPSEIEQWGLVVNEAMASGLAVIVSNRVGCLGDLVVDGINGLVFPYDDPRKLCECLRVLAENPLLRQQLGRRAEESVGRWDCRKHSQSIQELVEMEGRRPDWRLSWWYGILLWVAIMCYRIVRPKER